jgi:hypothetical protein
LLRTAPKKPGETPPTIFSLVTSSTISIKLIKFFPRTPCFLS